MRVMLNLSFLLKGANQARSFDIRESHSGTSDRPPVSKSFSFGGYPAPQVRESNQVLTAIGVLILFLKLFSLWSQGALKEVLVPVIGLLLTRLHFLEDRFFLRVH